MLRARFARYQLIIGAIILIVGSLAGMIAVDLWDRFFRDEAIQECQAVVRSLGVGVAGILARPEACAPEVLQNTIVRAREEASIGAHHLQVRNREGTVIAECGEPGPVPAAFDTRSLGPGVLLLDEERGLAGGILVTEPLRTGTELLGTISVQFDMTSVDRRMDRAVLTIVALTAGGSVFTALFVGWLIRRWVIPIKELSRTMDQVQVGNLEVHLDESRPDEIGDLGRHFNEMIRSIRSTRGQSLELARKQANIEKFAALGRLSAGVAHEINNPVGGILTCIETMQRLEPGSERFDEYLSLVHSGLERIGKIVKQLLRFARQPEGERKDLELNAILKEVMVLSLFHSQDEEVEVALRFGELPIISGAPDLLNQLFLNLVLNALQEMPNGGTLTVCTWAEDERVCASFQDTGTGIPEENLERIFEPFFTTKEVGVGTGLGLSVALGIVEAHGGTISAENLETGGALFVVKIPIGARPTNASKTEEQQS
jgi:two-component system, NtrC family, sensor kinase